ncbi:phenolic glucoside malonyltransferase 1-like [Phaseolus vulgaris]|uniref:phenolic glucoside malonyltransferase 1-like n=1 Tax=Phaseolus vulgaris TaxID=3885 RepID=UPI0035CAFE1B
MKIHEQCTVAPPPSATKTSLTLTFFDLFWLRIHPLELTFFYSLASQQSNPSFFFANVVPKLKTSLSHTLQHFLPLAGNVVWPSDSPKPFVQFTPGDAVSVVVAESDAEFDQEIDYSPRETAPTRPFIPHLHSSESLASVMSIQITLFPNKGFSIGMNIHHAVLDGKSAAMFIKAWAFLCQTQTNDETQIPSLVPELLPSFDRTLVKEPAHLRPFFTENLTGFLSNTYPQDNSDGRCLKILDFPPKDAVRATFVLTGGDLEKIKRRVLSKWEVVEESNSTVSSKPPNLSSFVVICAYVAVCIAKAVHGVEREKDKFAFLLAADWRFRSEPRIPDNYFGNCVWNNVVDSDPLDFIKEEGVVLVAKRIHRKVKMLGEEAVLEGFSQLVDLMKQGAQIIGVSMSNRFGVYDTNFGFGKPSKVEITSLDRNSSSQTFGLVESKDGSGGVEVEIVMNKQAMDLFATLFREGLCDDESSSS